MSRCRHDRRLLSTAFPSRCADDEIAAVQAVEAYVLSDSTGTFEQVFGLVLHSLYELEIASDVAITG